MRMVFLCEDIFIPDVFLHTEYKISKTGFGTIGRAFKNPATSMT